MFNSRRSTRWPMLSGIDGHFSTPMDGASGGWVEKSADALQLAREEDATALARWLCGGRDKHDAAPLKNGKKKTA